MDSATEFGLKVRKGIDEETTIGYDVTDSKLFVNRIKSGEINFSEHFPGTFEVPFPPHNKRIKIHIFVDRSLVEVFGSNGQKVITSQIFPSPESKNIALYAKDGNVKLISMTVYPLKSTLRKNED